MKKVSSRRSRARSRRRRGGLGALGVGAGLMYFFDPVSGKRRRGLVRDKATHYVKLASRTFRKGSVDLRHRAEGLAAETRARFDRRVVADEVLLERVRSKMGTVVSHPRAIDVHVRDGVVTLTGPILSAEAERLVRKTAHVRGTLGLVDRLERHETTEHVPSLQAGRQRAELPQLLQTHWAPGIRLLAGGGGIALVRYGRRVRGLVGAGAILGGTTLTIRAVANMPLRRLVGLDRGYRAIDIQKDIHVEAPVSEVYAFLSEIENLPRFMSHLHSVERVNDVRSHWVGEGPAGVRVDWDSVLTRRKENEIIEWRSTPESTVRSKGLVRFEDRGKRGTLVEVHLSYNPPAGMLGHAIASLFGADPKRALDDDLLRLKSLLERGKARAHGEVVTREEVEPGTHAAPQEGAAEAPAPPKEEVPEEAQAGGDHPAGPTG